VSDKDIPTSGSRWEQAGNDAGRTPTPPERTPVAPAEHEHPPGLVLAGGFGGFALRQATAGDGPGAPPDAALPDDSGTTSGPDDDTDPA
jgi:hypothetical protein